MKRFVFACALVASTALLSGCFVPEKFDAGVTFKPDGAYSYKYVGTAAFFPAVLQDKKSKEGLTKADSAKLAVEMAKYVKSKGVGRVSDEGHGHYKIEIDAAKNPGERATVLDAMTISTDLNGVTTVSAITVKDQDKREFEKLGIKIDGKLQVVIPENAELIKSNGSESKSFFSSFGSSARTYSWKLGSFADRPIIQFRLKK